MIKEEVRKRLAAEIAASGRDMKEVSLAAGLGETYVRDALKRGRGKLENIIKVFAVLSGDKTQDIDYKASEAQYLPTDEYFKKYLEELEREYDKNNKTNMKEAWSLLGHTLAYKPSEQQKPFTLMGSPLPVLGAGRAGDDGKLIYNGETIEWVPRPPMLEGVEGAYATYVAGDSMKPRFKEGEKVWVHPKRMPKNGDDVVVQLAPKHDGEPPEGYIKEFRRWSGPHLVLYQYNPPGEFTLNRDEVQSVHVIIGSLYV